MPKSLDILIGALIDTNKSKSKIQQQLKTLEKNLSLKARIESVTGISTLKRDMNSYQKLWDKILWEKKQKEKKNIEEIQKAHHKALQMNAQKERDLNEGRFKSQNSLHRQKMKHINEEHAKALKVDRERYDVGRFQRTMSNRVEFLMGDRAGKFVDSMQIQNFQNRLMELNATTPNVRRRMAELRNEFGNINRSAQTLARNTMNITGSFKEAMSKFPIWIATATIFMQTINSFRYGINQVLEMDKALTDLSKVVDLTNNEMLKMKNTAVDLGKEFGKSGVEVMNAFAEFGRFTKDLDEIQRLSESAILASNVSTLTADTAAKAIATTMVSFKMSAEESMSIVDKFNEVQNRYKTNAEDLAEAVSTVGSAANQAGINLDELVGYTTAVSAATGKAGGEIATA